MDRDAALDYVESLIDAVETEPMPVPVREIWVYGDVALGLDPLDRLDVYVKKDLLLGSAQDADAEDAPDVKGVGSTVSAAWAAEFPEYVQTNASGYAAPEKCLAAHLLPDDEPVHLEVCNASFDDNVTQRLEGALARDAYTEILDPRGVCLWVDGTRSDEALRKLRESEFAFPTLSAALEMLGVNADTAAEATEAIQEYEASKEGTTVRGDVV